VLLKNDNLESLTEKSIKELIVPLTEYLRMTAYNSGWPAHLVQKMNVTFDNDYNLLVDYPDDVKEDIEDLEYGDLNGLPNAAIRPFLLRAPGMIGLVLEQKILPSMLLEMGVI
jgi:hypothetical protein